MNNEEKRKIL